MKENNARLADDFIRNALFRLDESMRMITKSLQFLDETTIWKKPNNASNSVGNIMVHLCGNISQYILSGLAEQGDTRNRDQEFSITGGMSKTALQAKLQQVIEAAKKVIEKSTPEQLLKQYSVQGFQLSGMGIVLHVVEHLSYHTGQLAFYTKLIKDQDLGFYDGFDLNIKNEL